MDEPLVQIEVENWGGRKSNLSPHHLKPGDAVVQSNCRSLVPGQLDVRGGMTPVGFTNGTTQASGNVVGVFGYPHPLGPTIIYQLDDGTVKAGRNPG